MKTSSYRHTISTIRFGKILIVHLFLYGSITESIVVCSDRKVIDPYEGIFFKNFSSLIVGYGLPPLEG